jgi:multidrug efflux system outer membrane protein
MIPSETVGAALRRDSSSFEGGRRPPGDGSAKRDATRRRPEVGGHLGTASHLSLALALIVPLLSSCTLAPHYERPAAPVTSQYPETKTSALTSTDRSQPTAAADLAWNDFFGDPRLRELVKLSLANNRDLRVAALNVQQVEAQFQIARLALIPSLDADGTLSRSRTAADLSTTGRPYTGTVYSAVANIPSYELDFFGRVRSLRDEALEIYFATEEAQKTAQLSLISQVALQYLTERATAEQLRLSEETLKAVETSNRIARDRYNAGTTSKLDLATTDAQVQTARTNVAAFRQQLAQATNALVLLVGQPLPTDLPPPAALDAQNLVADLSAGLPSDLLERRPDIRAAEHQLKAANADIGVARAAFFPKITLTASAGSASTDLARLFKPENGTWSFVPKIEVPIFNGGRNRATLDIAKLQKEIEIANYEKAIQSAFREVADALVVRAWIGDQLDASDALVRAQQTRYNLSNARYKQGVDNYLTVLLAQQDLFAAQQNQIRVRLAKYSNLVSLYRALGGGWK